MAQSATAPKPNNNSYKVYVNPSVFDDYKNKIVREDEKDDKVETGRWPNARIPYIINEDSDKQFVALLNAMIDEFNEKTVVQWVNKEAEHTNYVQFKYNPNGGSCYFGCSFEGRQPCDVLRATKTEILCYMMKSLGFDDSDCGGTRPSISASHCDNESVMFFNTKCKTLSAGDIYAINILYNDLIDDCKIDEYMISRAFVLIICISSYDKHDDLPGTKIDKTNMLKLWRNQYGYKVLLNENDRVTLKQLYGLLGKCRTELSTEENAKKYKGLFVIFSCHGTEDTLICSDGKTIKREKIAEWFNGDNVPFMSNKPKIIIMDACRGNGLKFGVKNNNKNNNNNDEEKKQVMKGPNDDEHHPDEQITLLYSTTKGYAVPDDDKYGGNVIRTIYNTLSVEDNINKYHLDDLFKITQKRVKKLCSATQCIEQRNLGNDVHIFLKKNK